MTILNHPSALELSGNLTRFRISSAEAFTFVLKKGSEVLLSQVYNPGSTGIVEIDVREAVESKLSYLFQDASAIYEQVNLVGTFTATIDATVITFTAIRSGVDRFADSATNFLTANFLTWQPQVKHVTYYSPEFLTYYSPAGGIAKLVAHYSDDTTEVLTIGSLASGKAYTIPLQYASVNALLTKKLPSYYDVYVTNAGGDRLSYIQRFAASNIKSEDERWFLFENSLGGLDTIRAYGADGFTGEHTHNIADIDEVAEEYRVDTSRIYSKNTGYLDDYERRWLLDFFPSKKKYVYTQSAVRQIVVTESDVDYNSKDLPSSYSFKYRFSEAKPYLNLSRVDEIPDEITLYTPDVGSFTLPLRLNDLPHIELTEGALIPGQNPYSEHAGVFSVAELIAYLKSNEQLDVAFVRRSATGATIEGNGKVFGVDVDADGNLVFNGNIYATGSVSALGVGVGGGGTSYNRLDTWAAYIPGTTDTWVLSALLGHDLHTRVTALESDTPNVAWGVPTTDYVPLTVNAISRQLSIHGHGHTFASLASKPTTIAGYGITDSLIYEGDARLTNSRPASDVSAWAKAATKPSYSYTEVGAAAASHVHGAATTSAAGFMSTTDKSKLDGIEAQANKYIHPTKTSRSAGGPAHFITAFTSDTLGHVTGITTAAMTKADVEAVLTGNSITSHYHDDRYFQKGELFTKEGTGTEADPYRIRANFPFYGISSVAALGIGTGGGGTSYDRLDSWTGYDVDQAGWVLSAGLGHDTYTRVLALEASTPNVAWGVDGSGYTPLSVNGITRQLSTNGHTHDDRYYTETEVNTLLANKANWDTAYGWGNHASGGYAAATSLTSHTGNTSNPHGVTKTQVGLGNVANVAALPLAGGTLTGGLIGTTANFTGNVGIGTTSPASKLHIQGSWASTRMDGDYVVIMKPSHVGGWARDLMIFKEYNGTDYLSFGAFGADDTFGYGYIGKSYYNTWMRFYPTSMNVVFGQGNVGIGKTDPQDALDVNGNIRTSSADGSYMQIGAGRLVWDATNNALKVIKADGTAANFYATGSNTAFGIGTGEGGSSYNMVSDWSQYVAGSEQWVVSAQLINAIRTSVTGHIGDGTHASAGEKSNWNAAYSHSLVSGGVHMTSTDRNQLATAYNHSQAAHQAIINGTGFVKANGTTLSYDSNTYLTSITKAQVEAVLTGEITSHTHAYDAAGTASGAISAHNATFNHDHIANGQTAYGWGNHASVGYALNSVLASHTGNTSNPHAVTRAQIGAASGSYASYPFTGATQYSWVRIARITNCSAYGVVSISNNYHNNPPGPVTFSFAVSYRSTEKSFITQIGGSNLHILKARILAPTSFDADCYLEIYTTSATPYNNIYFISLANSVYTVLYTEYTAGSIPSGYTAREITFRNNGVVSDYFVGSLEGNASTATKLNGDNVGGLTTPVYFSNGVPTAGTTLGTAAYKTDTYFALLAGASTQDFTVKSLIVYGEATIVNGYDFRLKANTAHPSDPGDIVWLHNSGAELHRLWAGSGTLNYRASGGTTYGIFHAGNSNLTTIDWSTKNLTVAGTASVTGLLTASGNIKTANVDGAYMQVGPIKILYDATYGAIRVEGNLYATGSNTAFGIGGGSGGGGLITNVYGTSGFGGTYSDVDLSSTFNAYAINSLYTALQGKQNTITGAISTLVSSNLYANYALVSGATGKIQASGVTATELSYLSGASSNIQSQLNSKPSVNSYPTAFSWNAGSTSGPTATISGSNMTAISVAAIPAASGTASGIVTTGAQSFSGEKSFNSSVWLAATNAIVLDGAIQNIYSYDKDEAIVTYNNDTGVTTHHWKNIFEGLLEVKTGNLLSADIAAQPGGTIQFANGATANEVPAIIGKSSSASTGAGLTLSAATANTNAIGDMTFGVRQNNNTDYADFTKDAFRWSRYATNLMTLGRNGLLTLLPAANTFRGPGQVPGTHEFSVAGDNMAIYSTRRTTDGYGVMLTTMTINNNTAGSDMRFNVREQSNADFNASYLSNVAFRWDRYTTAIMSLTRGGKLTANEYAVSALAPAPASASAAGTTGEIRFTGVGIFICIATNTWRKATISTF